MRRLGRGLGHQSLMVRSLSRCAQRSEIWIGAGVRACGRASVLVSPPFVRRASCASCSVCISLMTEDISTEWRVGGLYSPHCFGATESSPSALAALLQLYQRQQQQQVSRMGEAYQPVSPSSHPSALRGSPALQSTLFPVPTLPFCVPTRPAVSVQSTAPSDQQSLFSPPLPRFPRMLTNSHRKPHPHSTSPPSAQPARGDVASRTPNTCISTTSPGARASASRLGS